MRFFPILLSGLCLALPLHAQEPDPPPPPPAQALIDHYHMDHIPHEGPWFVQTHKSTEPFGGPLAARYDGPRPAYTATYLLLTASDFSGMHRLKTDEMWHFYEGDPAELVLLYPDGHGETRLWGSDVLKGQEPQILVPAGTWMGARPLGDPKSAWSFGANTLTPGFDYADYEHGYRDDLTARYPAFAAKIARLTRANSLHRPAAQATPKAAEKPEPIALTNAVGRTGPQLSTAISATRFTMQPGAHMPMMMTQEGHEVMIVTAGTGRVTVGGKSQPVAPGAIVYLPPRIPHSIDAETRLDFTVATTPAWQASDTKIVGP